MKNQNSSSLKFITKRYKSEFILTQNLYNQLNFELIFDQRKFICSKIVIFLVKSN